MLSGAALSNMINIRREFPGKREIGTDILQFSVVGYFLLIVERGKNSITKGTEPIVLRAHHLRVRHASFLFFCVEK